MSNDSPQLTDLAAPRSPLPATAPNLGQVSVINLLDFSKQDLETFFLERGEKKFRAVQVMKWIYHRGESSFETMTDLGKDLRIALADVAEIRPPELITEQVSTDGTRKWLFRVSGNNAVETVFIPEKGRGTLCVSSQVGCALNCSFCSTATQGFSRNLSVSEIIGQVWQAAKLLGHSHTDRKITNVVMMGMGEPLLNFDAVLSATQLMMDDLGFGLSARRVTLSTAGLVPMIDKLRKVSDVSLAVSLHAPDEETRNQLVPLNKKYPIPLLLESCRAYIKDKPRSRVTIEYTMIDGVNDSPQQAQQLAKLLSTVPCKLNIIPFNPFPGTGYNCSSRDAIVKFQQIVIRSGIVTTVRKTRGEDIAAACGQLVGEVVDRTRRQERHKKQLLAAARG